MPRLALAALLSLCWLALALCAAPAPRFRPKPAPDVTPGEWVLTWASIEARVTLSPGGVGRYEWDGRPWYGSWAWDAKTRTLHVHETADGAKWSSWSAELSDDLKGLARFGENKTSVSLRRVPAAR